MAMTPVQRATITATLSALNDNLPGDHATNDFTASIADHKRTSDIGLASIANIIERGLAAFVAKDKIKQGLDNESSTVPLAEESPSPAVQPATKRARLSGKSTPATQSKKAKAVIQSTDVTSCCLCSDVASIATHLVPTAPNSPATQEFWSFIGLFRGNNALRSLKAAAAQLDNTNPENLLNELPMCRSCHELSAQSFVSLLPLILAVKPPMPFPYNPYAVMRYETVVEFAGGVTNAAINIPDYFGGAKRLWPGDTVSLLTSDPVDLPLPHPLLMQINLLCNRMVVLRAAAGYPVQIEQGREGDTSTNPIQVEEDEPQEVNEYYTGVQDGAGSPLGVGGGGLEEEQAHYAGIGSTAGGTEGASPE